MLIHKLKKSQKGIHATLCFGIFRNFVNTCQFCLKSDTNNRKSTWIFIHIFTCTSLNFHWGHKMFQNKICRKNEYAYPLISTLFVRVLQLLRQLNKSDCTCLNYISWHFHKSAVRFSEFIVTTVHILRLVLRVWQRDVAATYYLHLLTSPF